MVCTLEKLKAANKFLNESSPKRWKNETDDVKGKVREKHFSYQTNALQVLIPLKLVSAFIKHVLLPLANSSRKALYNLPIWPLLVMLQRLRSFEDCLN